MSLCLGALCLSPGYSHTKPGICLAMACRGRSGTVYGGNNVIRVAGNVNHADSKEDCTATHLLNRLPADVRKDWHIILVIAISIYAHPG